MVRMPEVEFGVDLRMARSVKEVGNARKGVAVFLRDLVESLEVDAKTK